MADGGRHRAGHRLHAAARATRPPVLVRIVEGVEGAVEMECVWRLRFDYGKVLPWVRRIDHAIVAIAGPDSVWLRTPVKLIGHDLAHEATFTVRAGERVPFVFSWTPVAPGRRPPRSTPFEALAATEQVLVRLGGQVHLPGAATGTP